MTIPVGDIKSLLITNGLQDTTSEGSLERLAEEISESISRADDRKTLEDTIYNNLSASGINIEGIGNPKEIAERIAATLSTSPYIE